MLKSAELTDMTVAQLAPMIRARDIAPSELLDAFLDRIEQVDPLVAAFVDVAATLGHAEAKARDEEIARGHYRGPLHGIPFAVKDVMDVEGLRTTAGSRRHSANAAARDATCVARLRKAGAVVLGKTATYEYATGGPSFDLPWKPTRNPWNLDHASGGSSTGSAAAVAAGMAPLALGSDTGGSVRVPASYCGLTGFKPTFGRIDMAGVLPLAPSLDTVGLLCRSAADAAIGFQALAGKESGTPDAVGSLANGPSVASKTGLKGIKIGLVRHLHEGAPSDLTEAMEDAEAAFRRMGAEIVDVSLPRIDFFGACQKVLVGAEAFAIHRQYLADDPAGYGEVFRYRVLPGMLVLGSDYVAATWMRKALTNATLSALEPVGILLTATTLDVAPAFKSMPLYGRLSAFLTGPFSVTGLPTICVCNGVNRNGLPLSMQIVGKPFDEETVLRVAKSFQCETSWHTQRPALDISRPAPESRTPEWTPTAIPGNRDADRLIDTCLNAHGIALSDTQRLQLREGAESMIPAIMRVRTYSAH